MSTKRPSVTVLSELIQKYVGSDFDKVSDLGAQLAEVLKLSGLTAEVDYSAYGFPQDNLEELLREFATTITQNRIAAESLSSVNNSITLNSESLASILATAIFKGTYDVNALENLWVVNEDDMVSNLETKVPTQRSVRRYVESSIATSSAFQGEYDASNNLPTLDDRDAPGVPIISGILRGFNWTVTTTGTFFGQAIATGDKIQAIVDNPTTLLDWIIISNTLDGATIATLYEAYADVNRFTDSEALKLSGIDPGATDDQIATEVPYTFPVNGGVKTASINAGGVDYFAGIILTATSGTGTGLKIRVEEVDNGVFGGVGAITGFTIIEAGQNYLDTDTGITFTSTIGDFATLDVDTVESTVPNFVPTNVSQAIQELLSLAQRTELDTVDGVLYVIDPSRNNKKLSASETVFNFTKEGLADGMYLKPGILNSVYTGYRLPRDATLVGVVAVGSREVEGIGDGNSKVFDIRKDGASVTTFQLGSANPAGTFTATTFDFDFDAGEMVQVFATGTGDPVNNSLVTLYFKWRKA